MTLSASPLVYFTYHFTRTPFTTLTIPIMVWKFTQLILSLLVNQCRGLNLSCLEINKGQIIPTLLLTSTGKHEQHYIWWEIKICWMILMCYLLIIQKHSWNYTNHFYSVIITLQQGCPNLFLEEPKMLLKKLKEPSFKLDSQVYTIQFLALMCFLFKSYMIGTKQ